MAHGDYTGQSKAELARAFHDQQKLASEKMSLVTQVVSEGRHEEINLFNEDDHERLRQTTDPDEDGVVQVDGPDPLYQPVKFQARETLENVTIGKDRNVNLAEGQTYKAPLWVVRHLDEKNLVRH